MKKNSLWTSLTTLAVAGAILSGCATIGGAAKSQRSWAEAVALNNKDLALQTAQDIPGSSDVLTQLQIGRFYFLSGDYKQSVKSLENALIFNEEYQTTSIMENISSATMSEMSRQYILSTFERSLVYVYKMEAYLLQGKLSSALVEARRVDQFVKSLDVDDRPGSLSLALLLSGYVFDLHGDKDNAVIAYRDAYRSMGKPRSGIVPILFARALYHSGRRSELASMPRSIRACAQKRANLRLGVLERGLITTKRGLVIIPSAYDEYITRDERRRDPDLNQAMSEGFLLTLSGYPEEEPFLHSPEALPASFKGCGRRGVEPLRLNLEREARDAHAEAFPGIVLRAVLREHFRQSMANENNINGSNPDENNNNILGSILSLTSAIMDEPDTRSWSLLPSEIALELLDAKSLPRKTKLEFKSVRPTLGELDQRIANIEAAS